MVYNFCVWNKLPMAAIEMHVFLQPQRKGMLSTSVVYYFNVFMSFMYKK